MSPDELAQMQNTNKVVQGGGGQTFISTNGIADFNGLHPKALSMLSLMFQLKACCKAEKIAGLK